MTKFHVNVVLGTLPPLLGVQLAHTQKFDKYEDAMKWANKFKWFLENQKRTKKHIVPTAAEIKFHGGQHIGVTDGKASLAASFLSSTSPPTWLTPQALLRTRPVLQTSSNQNPLYF